MKLIESRHPATGDVIYVDVENPDEPRIAAYWLESSTFDVPDINGEQEKFQEFVSNCGRVKELGASFFDEYGIITKLHKDLQPGEGKRFECTAYIDMYYQLLGHYWGQRQSDLSIPRYAMVVFNQDASKMYILNMKWGGTAEHSLYISPLTSLPQLAQDNVLIGVMTYEETMTALKRVLEEQKVREALAKIGLESVT